MRALNGFVVAVSGACAVLVYLVWVVVPRAVVEWLGVGALVDVAEPLDSTLVAGVAYWHPFEPVTVVVGPGIDRENDENLFAFRVGGQYEFIFKGFKVKPSVFVDFLEGGNSLLVYGLSVSKFY